MSIVTLSETRIILSLSEFTQIKLLKLEKLNGNFTREILEISFTNAKNDVVIDVDNSSNEIIIVVLELNHSDSELIYYNKIQDDPKIEQEDPEMQAQLDTLKNLFGGENQLSLTDSSIDETNNVFNNFGKGLSSMFSMAPTPPTTPPLQPVNLELNKNENSKLSWKIKKKE